MDGLDWVTIINGLGAAAAAIREMAGTNTKVEVIRERMGLIADRLDLSKDHLAFLKDALAREETRAGQLQEEIKGLRAENQRLQLQISAFNQQAIPETFVERHGLLFKRMADGNWSSNAHCPNCRTVLTEALQHLTCSKCKWTKMMGRSAAHQALTDLRAEDAAAPRVLPDYEPFKDA